MADSTGPERLAHPRIFINLPVADVTAAAEFYAALGWNEATGFRDENSASLAVNDQVTLVLLAGKRFGEFTDRDTAAADGAREAIHCVQVADRDDVEEMVVRAREAGGRITREPTEEGAAYGAAFDDLDGHGWELMWLDLAALED